MPVSYINRKTAKDSDAVSLRHPLVTTCLFVDVVLLVLQVSFRRSFAVPLKRTEESTILSSTIEISQYFYFAVPVD